MDVSVGKAPETAAVSPLGVVVPPRRGIALSPINRRRWENFKSNRRGFYSLWVFLVLFVASLFANFIASDKPFLVKYDGGFYFPSLFTYAETTFGGEFETAADYRDPDVQKWIAEKNGYMVWAPVRYSYDTYNKDLPTPAPSSTPSSRARS